MDINNFQTILGKFRPYWTINTRLSAYWVIGGNRQRATCCPPPWAGVSLSSPAAGVSPRGEEDSGVWGPPGGRPALTQQAVGQTCTSLFTWIPLGPILQWLRLALAALWSLLWVNTPTVNLLFNDFLWHPASLPEGQISEARMTHDGSLPLLWFPWDLGHVQGHWLHFEERHPETRSTWEAKREDRGHLSGKNGGGSVWGVTWVKRLHTSKYLHPKKATGSLWGAVEAMWLGEAQGFQKNPNV